MCFFKMMKLFLFIFILNIPFTVITSASPNNKSLSDPVLDILQQIITTTPETHITSFLYQKKKDPSKYQKSNKTETTTTQQQHQNSTKNSMTAFNFNDLESVWKTDNTEKEDSKKSNRPTHIKLFKNLQIANFEKLNETNTTNDIQTEGKIPITSKENSDQFFETTTITQMDSFNQKDNNTKNNNEKFLNKFRNNLLVMKVKNNTKKAFGRFILGPIFNIFAATQRNSQRSLSSVNSLFRPFNELFQQNMKDNRQQQEEEEEKFSHNDNDEDFSSFDDEDNDDNGKGQNQENIKTNNKNTIHEFLQSIRENFNANVNAGFNLSDKLIERLQNKGFIQGLKINGNNNNNNDKNKNIEKDNNERRILLENLNNGRLFFNENLGITILEIFGAVVGLAWGAFSHFQNIFTQQQVQQEQH